MWKAREVNFIDYYEFNELVEEHLGIEYNIVANEELRNDSLFRLGVVPCKYWDAYNEAQLAKTLDGEHPMYASYALAHELVRRKVIPAGEWIVTVSW